MSFRFIHTADLHLDAPLTTIALRDPDLATEVGVASRAAFSRIIDLCISENVAFLLIAGDLWDGEYSSTQTPRFVKQELLRLKQVGIRCFMIRGNHDAMARQTGELDAPDNTTVFGAQPKSMEWDINGHPIVVHGLSFREVHAPDSLLPRYPAAKAGAFNIGMLHTSLNGSPGHDPYAPCSVSDLEGHGYDYWALGHIHRRAQHVGRSTIVMPGTPQGRDIGEAGPASVTMVDVADDNSVTVTECTVSVLRFDRVAVDCAGVEDWFDLLDRLEVAIRRAGDASRPEQHLVIRPVLGGATPLAWRLARDLDRLSEEARAFAAASGVWIDKLELRVSLPDGEANADPGLPDALAAMILNDLPRDPGIEADLVREAAAFLHYLPPEVRGLLGQGEDELPARCKALLEEAIPATLARLAVAEGG